MKHGPVDFIMVGFEGDDVCSSVADGIRSLVQAGTIRIIDLIFVEKDDAGELHVRELADLPDAVYETWNAIVDDVEGMLSSDDAEMLAADLLNNRSAVLALYENIWAREMAATIQNASGEVLVHTRIPRSVIEELEMVTE